MKILRSCVKLVVLICLIWQFAAIVWAQNYPTKPIRIVVPSAAGGGTDILTRILSEKMSQSLGQQVIVDCRGGAGGNIGTEIVANSRRMVTHY